MDRPSTLIPQQFGGSGDDDLSKRLKPLEDPAYTSSEVKAMEENARRKIRRDERILILSREIHKLITRVYLNSGIPPNTRMLARETGKPRGQVDLAIWVLESQNYVDVVNGYAVPRNVKRVLIRPGRGLSRE